MEAVLTTFGIDWRLLLINAVNFGVLMAALWYFLYTPVMNMLEERRKAVAKGVEDAERAAQEREKAAQERSEVLQKAGKEADMLIAQARATGSQKEAELVERGEAQAQTILRDAQAQAQDLKMKALDESKQEVAKLIVLGIEKTVAK